MLVARIVTAMQCHACVWGNSSGSVVVDLDAEGLQEFDILITDS
jgi:hypothetical protein